MRVKLGLAFVLFSVCYLTAVIMRLEAASPTQATAGTVKVRTPRKERSTMRTIKVHNVRPSMLAYWLDPKHQPVPGELQSGQKSNPQTTKQFSNPYGTSGQSSINSRSNAARGQKEPFSLPEGVDRIVAVDSQGFLFVYGTEKGINAIESLVSTLDRPLRLIELTMQYVEVERGSWKDFGIDLSSANGPFTARSNATSPDSGTFSLGVVRSTPAELQATLDGLVARGQARRLGSHQTVTPSNLATTTSMRTTGAPAPDNNIPVAVDIETKITPTINADESITVLMLPKLHWRTTASGLNEQSVNTVANVRSGDTIALGGLRGPNRDIILFLTARAIPAHKSET